MTILSNNKKQGQCGSQVSSNPGTNVNNVVVNLVDQSLQTQSTNNSTLSSSSKQQRGVIVLVNEAQDTNLTQTPLSPSNNNINKTSQVQLINNASPGTITTTPTLTTTATLTSTNLISASTNQTQESLLLLGQKNEENSEQTLKKTDDLIKIEEKVGCMSGAGLLIGSNGLSASTSGLAAKKSKNKNNKRKMNTEHNSAMRLQPPQQRQRSNLVSGKTTSKQASLLKESGNDESDEVDSDGDLLTNSDSDCVKDSSDEDDDDELVKHDLPQQQQQQQQHNYQQQQQQFNQRFFKPKQENEPVYGNIFMSSSNNNSRAKSNKGVNKKGVKSNNAKSASIQLKQHQKEEKDYLNNNSEDEYEASAVNVRRCLGSLVDNISSNGKENLMASFETLEELEEKFRQALKEKRGFIIKPIKEDGACLFRAVADQIYGDEEMHSVVRCHCMDYIAKNADDFKQYMTEDVTRYIRRKREETCHGNHIEIIAMSEIYNRRIEVYEYSAEPKNTFQSVFQTDNEPIRLSYHGRNHYNSVINPYKATIGVGLGLPQLTPGLAEKNLMSEALRKSEEFHLEQTMLDDKLSATDWEATNEEIMEIVARESYLQWLKDNEKRLMLGQQQQQQQQQYQHNLNLTNATCSTWDDLSPSKQSPNLRHNNHLRSLNNQTRRSSNSPPTPPLPSTSTSLSPTSSSQSKQHTLKSSGKEKPKLTLINNTNDELAHFNDNDAINNTNLTSNQTILNELPPDLFGLNGSDWIGLDENVSGTDGDILARVLAASQQEYLESLKAKRHQQQQQQKH